MVAPWAMSGGVGSSRRFPFGNIRLKVMAHLILNCRGVGLIMRELSRDIVMIGRSPFSAKILGIPTLGRNPSAKYEFF
jgi:hypothetical protein